MKRLLASLLCKSVLIKVSAIIAILIVSGFVIMQNVNMSLDSSSSTVNQQVAPVPDNDSSPTVASSNDGNGSMNVATDDSKDDVKNDAKINEGEIQNGTDSNNSENANSSNRTNQTTTPDTTSVIPAIISETAEQIEEILTDDVTNVIVTTASNNSSGSSSSGGSSGSSNSDGSTDSEDLPSVFNTTILENIAAISISNIDITDKYIESDDELILEHDFDESEIKTEITSVIGSSGIAIDSIDYNESLNKLVVTLSKSEQTTTVVLEKQGIVLRNYVTLDLNETALTLLGFNSPDRAEQVNYANNVKYLTPIEGYTTTPPSLIPFVSNYGNINYPNGNFTFLGWYTESLSGELFNFTSTPVTEPFTLYAHWAKNTTVGTVVSSLNTNKFQDSVITANTADSYGVGAETTDAEQLWKATGIEDPTTITLFNENDEILYSATSTPATATINWGICENKTENDQIIFTLEGTVTLPSGYTWADTATATTTITRQITIDTTSIKVSSFILNGKLLIHLLLD